jgi:hypothetical protein
MSKIILILVGVTVATGCSAAVRLDIYNPLDTYVVERENENAL